MTISLYYATEDDWRAYTGFTDPIDFPSGDVQICLANSTEQVKKDGFVMQRYELVTKDSNDKYYVTSRYFANKYGTTNINEGTVTKYDIVVWEGDNIASTSASLAFDWSHVNNNMYAIPYDAITDIDPLNCWFKLTDAYPTTSERQIYVTYWISGKPISEIAYELKMACMEQTTIQMLRKLKAKRLYNGTISYTLGSQTIQRNEQDFDELVRQHYTEYEKWIQWFRPFIGRRVRIGDAETQYRGRYVSNRYV